MAKLIYSAITSLDGYIEDAECKFEWAEPDEELPAFVNDVERPVGMYLYGRRMYETMVFWESPPELTAQPPSCRSSSSPGSPSGPSGRRRWPCSRTRRSASGSPKDSLSAS